MGDQNFAFREGTFRNQIETDDLRNRRNTSAGRRGRGSRTWRGNGNASFGMWQPRNRTESWPAADNTGRSVYEQSAPISIPGGHCLRGGNQNWRGRNTRNFINDNRFPTNFDGIVAPHNRLASFSYGGPPPPIAQPNFYFEAESMRPVLYQMPPSVYMPPVNSRRPIVVSTNNGRQQEHRHGNDMVRLLEKPFGMLSLQINAQSKEDVEAIPSMLLKREIGLMNRNKMKRRIAEIRVQNGGLKSGENATTVKSILADHPGESLRHCQFMEATPDGKNIFGSWAMRDRDWSRIMCTRVDASAGNVDEGRYGINLTPTGNYIYVMDKNVVDLCRARVDNSVTCVLYVTVPAQGPPGSLIFLQPVPELSDVQDQSFLSTPIYNAHWALHEEALSCAWDFTRMRLSLGLERYGMIFDVVSEQDFKLFSCHKNVLAQKFSRDGSLLFMGVRDSSILCCDLRRQFHHAVYGLPQTSACWLSLLSDSNYLVAADFSGQINLWDLKMQRVLQSFNVQTTSEKKLPVVVDEQDSLIFAVGDNGTTNAWSLKTGKLLRQIPKPSGLVDGQNLPRLCYSGCWGGVPGNAAIVLGVGDEAHFYEMQLV